MDKKIKEEMLKMSIGDGRRKEDIIKEIDDFIDNNEDICDQVECMIDKLFVSKTERLLRKIKEAP